MAVKAATTWDVWFERQPGRFHQGVIVHETSTFYRHEARHRATETVKTQYFRTCWCWARLHPDGVGEVNPRGEFYNQCHRRVTGAGITPLLRCSI